MLIFFIYKNILEFYILFGSLLVLWVLRVLLIWMVFVVVYVVFDLLVECDFWDGLLVVDWDNMFCFCYWFWDQGFGLVEVMDIVQWGMGVDWLMVKELIEWIMVEVKVYLLKLCVVCGVGMDQKDFVELKIVVDIIVVYFEQMEVIEVVGGQVILMVFKVFLVIDVKVVDYEVIYGILLEQVVDLVVLYWFGDMFDLVFKGYWGLMDVGVVFDMVFWIINVYQDKVDGIKILFLDKVYEE